MYESHFELAQKPFSLLPDPDFLFLGRKHQSGLTLLEYSLVNQAGFTVITGEVGCGKTTLIRALLERMGEEYTVGLITNTHESIGELLEWVLYAFGLDSGARERVERYRRFVDFVIEQYAKRRSTVLIIDEAQNLSVSALEELRMLSNINADRHQVLQIVIAGQPELRDTLHRPELRQFAQRVAVDYHLEALDEDETVAYVRHRLRVAGGPPSLFRRDALSLVFAASGGVPRLVNLICDTALVYTYAQRRRRVTAEIVREVVADKMRGKRPRSPAPGDDAIPLPAARSSISKARS